jgi:tRNA threonylcarbamoyladenosine biosynthesis protein TsaB
LSLLLFESSTREPFVAWADGTSCRAISADPGGLAPAVAELGPDWSRVQAYGYSCGPGSFTGLRVGLSLLKGLAFIHDRPVIAVSSLRLWAATAFARDPAVQAAAPVLDARRGRVWAAVFTREGCAPHGRLPEGAYPVEAVRERLRGLDVAVVGDGAHLLSDHDPVQGAHRIDPQAFAAMVATERARGAGQPAAAVAPRYHLRTEVEERLDPDGRGGPEPTSAV